MFSKRLCIASTGKGGNVDSGEFFKDGQTLDTMFLPKPFFLSCARCRSHLLGLATNELVMGCEEVGYRDHGRVQSDRWQMIGGGSTAGLSYSCGDVGLRLHCTSDRGGSFLCPSCA